MTKRLTKQLTKRLVAALTIAIFIISPFMALAPIEAHFTLGDLTGTFRYHVNDFDPHVPGVIGYVWPGGGQNAYAGFPNFANVNSGPGYQSPYPGGKSGATPGSSGNAPSSSWYQLEGNAYAPFGAVLAESTGDLIFAINATAGFSGSPGWSTWVILIPPEFKIPDSSQIVSTLTNTYAEIFTASLSRYDRYAPNWTIVAINADAAINANAATIPYYSHQYVSFTTAGEWYYVRVNGVTAPHTAGRYFFKMLLYGGGTSGYLAGPEGTGSSICSTPCTQFLPTENWPVLLVKGEVDPAIITGTVRYAGYNQTLYSQPVHEAGRVYAKMTQRLDPYTGQKRPDLPNVDAVAYFNATAQGHYEVEGVAPGVYDLYASAAGYPQALIASKVTVLKGQSLHFDGYLQPGPVIHGNVYTKHQFGDEPWPHGDTKITVTGGTSNVDGQYIKIELYDAPTMNQVPDQKANMVSWSPLPCVAGGQETFQGGNGHAGTCGDPRLGSEIGFPWHEYVPGSGYGVNIAGIGATACSAPTAYWQVSASDNGKDGKFFNCLTQDPQGVGPPQHWYVLGGTTTPFHYEFGVKGEYGAPRDLDGMVPQVYATWVNGLTPGRYYARVWTFRYVQTGLDGSTFQEYYFDVTPNEWAGDVTLPIDLRLSSWVNETVHYHITSGTLGEDPIDTGAGFLYGYLVGFGGSGFVYSYNVTALGYRGMYASGSGAGGYTLTTPFISGEDLDPALINAHAIETGRATIQFWGINDTWGGENYGIPSDTYTPLIRTAGFLQNVSATRVSMTLSGSMMGISDHLYRGGGINLTISSIDWERPYVARPWVWGNNRPGVGSEIDLGFFSKGRLFDYLGDTLGSLPVTILTTGMFQGMGGYPCGNDPLPIQSRSCTKMDGGGRSIRLDGSDNANYAYFGREAANAQVGGSTFGTYIFLTQSNLQPIFTSGATTPSAFPTGTYDLRTYTYGYIQNKNFTVYVQEGQVANININLIIGVNVTLDILFKKQRIITPANANMSARVRLFNDQANLVAEWMSSEGTYTTATGNARAADGTTLYPFISLGNPTIPASGLNSYNFLPGGTSLLHVKMAGLPQQSNPDGEYGDPVFTPYSCDFVLTCYRGTYGRWEPVGQTVYPFLNTGILGAPDYQGGWTAEVDFVNWYANNTSTIQQPLTDGSQSMSGTQYPNYYPPVSGLLMGESYHIIPGTTATSGISLTEDSAVSSVFLGHSLAANHLGPYSQRGVWQITGAHNSGEASAINEVDLNGLVSGNALAFTWSNEFRPLSWGTLTVTGAGLPSTGLNFYTYDGVYEAYLPSTIGTSGSIFYTFNLKAPGYTPQTWKGAVSSGQTGTGQNLYLEQTNMPVPEFSAITIPAISAVAISLYVLRRRHYRPQHS